MFKNHFKTAWRNLVRDRQFSLLNLVGLSTGLACALLIYFWVNDELSVDKFNKKDAQLYEVLKTYPNADGTKSVYPSTQGMLATTMANELPEIEYAVAVRPQSVGILSINDKQIKAKSEFVGKDFLKIFSYEITEGDRSTVLSDKYGVLLSDKIAATLFNTTKNIIGKPFHWERGEFTGDYIIAGVFKAPPSNASDQFDLLFTYDLFATKEAEDIAFWGSNSSYTFITLKKGTDAIAFNKKIKDFTKEKIKALYKDDKEMLKWEGDLFLQRFSDRYLYNNFENGVQAGGRIAYVRLFSIIAIFIVVIACINFMNLSTAKASKRIKEVGIKKVVGASRGSLIAQYMGESVLMALLSLVLASMIVALLLPAFKEITGKDIQLQLNAEIIFTAIGIAFITGMLAGSYPALYLSGFRPALVLKGKLNTSAGESWIRKGLVVFQFSISVILVVAVMVVYQQMKLIQTTNLGYNRDNVISFSNDGYLKTNLAPFLAEVKKIPGVLNASSQNGNFIGNASHGGSGINWEGKDPNLGIEYFGNDVGYDFFETMGLKMAAGRPFLKEFADSNSVIFNEAAIKAMGIKDPIGKPVTLWSAKKVIVGVVKDYHFKSLYEKISPAFLTWNPNNETTLVKIKAATTQQTIAAIKNLFNQYNHGLSFDYRFLDDDYNALYASEQRVAVLSKYFAGIAIIISCLGLFGLTAFTAQKRQKEIGIRKVIGASISGVAIMLSKDFLKLVAISILIAFPVSWWAMHAWLQSFAYRVNLGAPIFVIAAIIILFITLLTVSFQSIKAAVANPVKSLRTD